MGTIHKSFKIKANDDGTIDYDWPLGTKGQDTLQWDVSTMQTLVGRAIGSPVTINIRQFLSGTNPAYVTAATLSVNSVSGTALATVGISVSGDFLTFTAVALGSGTLTLQAHHANVLTDAISAVISFSVVNQTPITPPDYDYVATADGLKNGGDPIVNSNAQWAVFGGTGWALNANPVTDTYLQITAGTSPWGGVSTNSDLSPTFQANQAYTVNFTVHAGSTWPNGAGVSINQGTFVTFNPTAGAKSLTVVGGGTPHSLVFSPLGLSSNGQLLRIDSLAVTAQADIIEFSQATFTGLANASSISFTVTRNAPTNNAMTVDVSVDSGGGFGTLVTTQLSWAANVGGTKTGTITPSAAGTMVLRVSNPSRGSIGTQATASIIITAASGAQIYPLVHLMWLTQDSNLWSTWSTAANQAFMGKFDQVVINGVEEGQSLRGGITLQTDITAIKAASTRTNGTRVLMYVGTEATYKPTYSNLAATLQTARNTNNWTLRDSYPSGNIVDSYFSTNGYAMNVTMNSNLDSSGRRYPQYLADYSVSWAMDGGLSNTACAALDGFEWDDIRLGPQRGGDWNQDGAYEDRFLPDFTYEPNLATRYRTGLATMVARYKAAKPTKIAYGNITDMVTLTNFQNQAPEYYRLFHGAFIEHFLTNSSASSMYWFDQNNPGNAFAIGVTRLQMIEDGVLNPEKSTVAGWGIDGNATSAQTYKEVCFGICMVTVCTNMGFQWTDGVGGGVVPGYPKPHFYDIQALILGTAVDARQTAAWSNGVWRRRFSAGAAYCNPPGNGSRTVSLGATMYVPRGDTSATRGLTPGAAVTQITLADRDGIFLSNTPT